MIRIVISFATLAVVLCLYIVLAPTASDDVVSTSEVTRNAVDPTIDALVEAPTPALTVVPPANSAASRILAATGAAIEQQRQIKTDNTTLQETSAAVLAALGVQNETSTIGDGTAFQDMTANILVGIGGATGKAPVATKPKTGLQSLVAAALKEGQSDAYIDALVNEAAISGSVSVPTMLVTSDGKVDTATLLASIVADAQALGGAPAAAIPEVPSGDGTGVEVRVVQRADETKQYRFYTVSSGDSLGSIAIKFYGSVQHYPKIFDANRQILSSPDRIQAGQRLRIPAAA